MEQPLKKHIYFAQGMHCAACEILIEKRLLEEKGIKTVEASTNSNRIVIKYTGKKPSIEKINSIFKENRYSFSDKETGNENNEPLFQIAKNNQIVVNKRKFNNLLTILTASFAIILIFLFLNKSGFAALLNVNVQSALPAFFIFGLLAGFSSCSALVGGIILSMSKQWLELYPKNDSAWQKFQPHLLFNTGRLLSYAILGAVLGVIGSTLQISLTFTSIFTVLVSILMIFLAFQMLSIKTFSKFQLKIPKAITGRVADEKNFKGKWMPALMGALTFFLPCGFTITAQGLALLSGNPMQASLIMFFFVLGTLPALLLIGLSSVKFTQKPHLADRFLKIAGLLVLFFAIYNINAQLNVLGLASLNDLNFSNTSVSKDGLPPVVNGKQIVKMDALSFAYEPDIIRVRSNVPVSWEITDKGTSGCTNAVISRSLFDGEINLTPGETSVKEFTPKEPGRYKFSCWMGMVSGIIEVVDKGGSVGSIDESAETQTGTSCGGSCGNPGCSYAN